MGLDISSSISVGEMVFRKSRTVMSDRYDQYTGKKYQVETKEYFWVFSDGMGCDTSLKNMSIFHNEMEDVGFYGFEHYYAYAYVNMRDPEEGLVNDVDINELSEAIIEYKNITGRDGRVINFMCIS